MRAHEFITESPKTILREYRRDITARQYGPKMKEYYKYSADSLGTLRFMVQGQFDRDSNDVINMLLAAFEMHGDPTTNKIYVPWIARQYSEGNIRRLEDLDSRIKPLLAQYHQYKNKGWFPQHAKDIMRMNMHQLSSLMVNLNIPQEQQVDRGESKEIYKDSDVRVIVPKDKTAACYYGQGTQWCTAATKGTNYFDRYNLQGPLYILLPTKPQYDGEKYQLHFESGQFMNERDDPVSPKELLVNRFPQLQELFKKQVDNLLEFAPDGFLRELYDVGVELVSKYFNDEMMEVIKNNQHNTYLDWLSARGVKLNTMTSTEFFKYENKPGYSFGEFDPGVIEIDDAIHEMRAMPLYMIRKSIVSGQESIGAVFTPGDIGYVLSVVFDEVINRYGAARSYYHQLYNYMQDRVVAKQGEYEAGKGMRKFKPYKQVGDWTVGEYV